MSRATIILDSQAKRDVAARWCLGLPDGTVADFRESKRTLDQNAKLWASLTDIACSLLHHGEKLEPDDWKWLFLQAMGRENRVVPALDGPGFVSLRGSSKLTKQEMSDLITFIEEFGARHGVKFSDGEDNEEAHRG